MTNNIEQKTNYHLLSETEKAIYHLACINILMENNKLMRVMSPAQVNETCLLIVRSVNVTIAVNPIIDLEKEMD